MASLKILICGGGCAGPALAYWLARSGHQVTVIERFPALRASGAQIDLRAQGIEVAKRMGLLEDILCKGAQSMTSEYEIMRGDLVRILYEATKDNVEYHFDKTVERFEQDENEVVVHFSDNSSDTFDLLVGADGQGSRIRKAIQPSHSPDPYRRFGTYIAYWFVPRIETDNNLRRMFHSPGGRMVTRRSHSPTETQVYFVLKDNSKELYNISRAPVEQQKEFWAQRFRDAGWETDRFLEGLKTTENFFCEEVVQVRTETWYKGRVVLLGDAACCPSPFSGMGTTGGLVGAYVLAGEINRNTKDLPRAFRNYDETLRPFANEIQKVNPLFLRIAVLKTRWGISLLHLFTRLLCSLHIPGLFTRLSREERGGWKLPDYPELNPGRQ